MFFTLPRSRWARREGAVLIDQGLFLERFSNDQFQLFDIETVFE
jgi:hypothetical protein